MKKIKMEIMLFISLMGVFALFFFILTLHQYMEIDRSKIFSQDVDPLPMKKPTVLESGFELPVEGATGYASISLNVRENVDDFSNVVLQLNPGDGFVILEETGDFWKIRRLNQEGYVRHKNCLINLPDVMPSIIYNISNSKASLMKSLGKNIPNITGQKLYDVYDFNERLNREEYAVPVLYSMAKKIAVAQRKALENKNTLHKIGRLVTDTEEDYQKFIEDEMNKENITNILKFINYYEKNHKKVLLYMNNYWFNYFPDKENISWAILIVIYFYKDVLNYKINCPIEIFNDYIDNIKEVANLNNIINLTNKIKVLNTNRNYLDNNANLNLLMDKIIIEMEVNYD